MIRGNQRARLLPRLALILIATLVSASTALAGAGVTVPVPCQEATQTAGLRKCADVLGGTNGTIPKPGILNLLRTQMQKQSDCFYQGVDMDPLASANGSCQGSTFGHPCSLVPNSLNGNASEITQDHNGKACGSFMNIKTEYTHCGGGLPPDLMTVLTAPPYNMTLASIDTMTASDLSNLMAQIQKSNPALYNKYSGGGGKKICMYFSANSIVGERERAYMRGFEIQALSYYLNKVSNEINCSKSITVGQNGSTACSAFADDLQKHQSMFRHH